MKTKKKTKSLQSLGIFTLSEAAALGFSQPTISRMVDTGELIRLERGIFQHPKAKVDFENLDFIVAAKRFGPGSVVGLMSALSYYGLIEQVPQTVWVLVPPEIKTISKRYRCIRTSTDSAIGTVTYKNFAMTNIERSIVEALRYSTKVGLDVAVKAARTAIKEKRTTASKIMKQARELKMEQFVIRHWEAISIG